MNPHLVQKIVGFVGLATVVPILASAVIYFLLPRQSRYHGIAAVLASTISLLLIGYCARIAPDQPILVSVPWLWGDAANFGVGVYMDRASLFMALMVCVVAWLVQIYSLGYMQDDLGRYFALMSLFLGTMLGLVLAPNFTQLFVCWELVGFCSYALIGHWFDRPSAADAARKAFVVNRVGDAAFLIGILMIWAGAHSLGLSELRSQWQHSIAQTSTATLIGLLVFCGAIAKSAQIPLHVWLPDAMEGPTPVSALIHAATMVAAGVYMLCRVHWLFTGDALQVIAWVGLVTAVFAAMVACRCWDIKRVLAYSTISQLGYMMLAVGLAVPAVAMFHLVTHAFSKALLFLVAGVVILLARREQDLRRLGGIARREPVLYVLFLLGALSLVGLPPFGGFYSKEMIVAAASKTARWMFCVLIIVGSALSGFYITRLSVSVFHGTERSQVSRSIGVRWKLMIMPALGLGLLSFASGWMGWYEVFVGANADLETAERDWISSMREPLLHLTGVGSLNIVAVLVGALTALLVQARGYYLNRVGPTPIARAIENAFYIDQIYHVVIGGIYNWLTRITSGMDALVIRGMVPELLRSTFDLTGRLLRGFQVGDVRAYIATSMFVLAVILWLLIRKLHLNV